VLTLGPYQVADLAFVPGHEALLFTSDRDREASELYLLPLSGDRQLLRLTFAGARALAVSSDGRKLLFASQRAGESADLFLASLVEAL
jgi:Tol biopolymer transport system component